MAYKLTEEEFSKGGGGTLAIVDTTMVTIKGYMIRVDADAVFSTIERNSVAADVRSTYVSTAGGTVAAGTWIVAGENNFFSKVTLTSGKVTLFKLPSTIG